MIDTRLFEDLSSKTSFRLPSETGAEICSVLLACM